MRSSSSQPPGRSIVRRLRGPYSLRELSERISVPESTCVDWERRGARLRPAAVRALLDHARKWHDDLGLDYRPLIREALFALYNMDDDPEHVQSPRRIKHPAPQ